MNLHPKLSGWLKHMGLNDLRARIEGENYLANRQRLFQRDIENLLDCVQPTNDQKKIVIWSPFAAWYHTLPEFFIATNLRLRGQDVLFAACDGSPPHCAMDRQAFTRPPCDECSKHSNYLLTMACMPSMRLTDFVSREEQKSISMKCNAMVLDEIKSFCFANIDIGEHAVRYLTTYFSGFVPVEENVETARRILAGEWIATLYSKRICERVQPDVVFMFSGNDAQHFGPFRYLISSGVRTITWDESAQWSDGFYFAQNSCAGDVDLDDPWLKSLESPLTDEQECLARKYVDDWRKGEVCGTIYHPSPVGERVTLSEMFGLGHAESTLLALPNVVWDSNVISRNVGFKDMKAWLKSLIEWFIGKKDKKLLIRAHPAEKRVLLEKHATREDSTLPALIAGMFPDGLPSNIIVIPGDNDVDTYELGELCDGVCAYSSNIALELALRGKRTWVAGKSFFRGKGFTCDVESPEHLHRLLDQGDWRQGLDQSELDLAYRFLYLWIFRYCTRIPWHGRQSGTFAYPKVHFENFQFLIPGNDPQLDAICDRILDGRPFLDIPNKTTARFKKTNDPD
jgi:hypothetical protein